MKKRKICFIITSKIHHSRSLLLLEELRARDDVDLQIVVGASAILPEYGDVIPLLEKDGYKIDARITMTFAGGSPVAMAKTTGMGIAEFSTVFENLQPDLVVVRGDRYEVLSAAIAASYLNIPVAHIEGGDVTGTIDESVRHAVTKLSHIHFATNEESKNRILKMGENPSYVFNFGCPGLEIVARNSYEASNDLINFLGVGDVIDIHKPYLMVMQHPVTSEIGKNKDYVNETLHAVHEINIPTIWFWPNIDAGTDETSKGIRTFREKFNLHKMRFIKYLPPDEFIGLLKKTICLVGNSSTGIKECSILGTPAVNIGTRQNKRMRGENVIDVNYNKQNIIDAINKHMNIGRYKSSNIYHQEGTSKKITDILANIDLYTQKYFID